MIFSHSQGSPMPKKYNTCQPFCNVYYVCTVLDLNIIVAGKSVIFYASNQ